MGTIIYEMFILGWMKLLGKWVLCGVMIVYNSLTQA